MVNMIHDIDEKMVKKIQQNLVTNSLKIDEKIFLEEENFSDFFEKYKNKYPMIMIGDESVLGIAYASPFGIEKAYNYSVNMQIYIFSNDLDFGIKSELLKALEDRLVKMGIVNTYIRLINDENSNYKQNINFYEEHGFNNVAVLEKCLFYQGKWYDVTCMNKLIGEHKSDIDTVVFGDVKEYAAFVIKEDKDYVVEIADFGISTRGNTKEEAVKKAKELMECVAESFLEEGVPLPDATLYNKEINDREMCYIKLKL